MTSDPEIITVPGFSFRPSAFHRTFAVSTSRTWLIRGESNAERGRGGDMVTIYGYYIWFLYMVIIWLLYDYYIWLLYMVTIYGYYMVTIWLLYG